MPLSDMCTGRAFGLGLLLTLPAVVGKVVPSLVLYSFKGSWAEGAVIGQGLACWGEIAYLMAKTSYDNGVFGEVGSSEAREVLAVLVWALLIGTSLMPTVFPRMLSAHLDAVERNASGGAGTKGLSHEGGIATRVSVV